MDLTTVCALAKLARSRTGLTTSISRAIRLTLRSLQCSLSLLLETTDCRDHVLDRAVRTPQVGQCSHELVHRVVVANGASKLGHICRPRPNCTL